MTNSFGFIQIIVFAFASEHIFRRKICFKSSFVPPILNVYADEKPGSSESKMVNKKY